MNKTMSKTMLFSLLAVSVSAQADWNFRGTPNSWANTALDLLSGSTYQTCQTFDNNDPRFKIDHYGNWNEAYPSSDYRVSEGSYLITFDSNNHSISTESVANCSGNQPPTPVDEDVWCLRGTVNSWGQTALHLNTDSGLYELTQAFAGEESPARFKIATCSANGAWGENYPTADYKVTDNTTYNITFNESSHKINVAKVMTPVKPKLTVNPIDGDFFANSLNVTLSYNGVSVTDSRYLIGAGDVTQGTVFANGDIISVGSDISVGQSVEVQVYVNNGEGATTQTYIYNKVEAKQTGFTVCVEGLTNPTIHHWSALPEDSTANSVWPGDVMTAIADGLFSYSFSNSDSSNIIFSESGNSQTDDLTRSSDGTYHIATGSWTDDCELPINDAAVSIDPNGGSFSTDNLTVTLHATGDDVTSGRYTIDGSAAVNGITFNDGATITIGDSLAIDQSMQVCLFAENSDSNADQCFTFTKVEQAAASDFTWDNANVYFVITDRFKDGNPSNNNSYGRPNVDATGKNIGRFN